MWTGAGSREWKWRARSQLRLTTERLRQTARPEQARGTITLAATRFRRFLNFTFSLGSIVSGVFMFVWTKVDKGQLPRTTLLMMR